jgi:TonB family protein
VAQDLRRTTAGMDQLLSSLNGTLAPGGGMPVAGNGSGSAMGGGGGRGKYALAGGRGTSELGSVEGTARGAGLGQVLGGRGVHKNGVAIVDQGVESSGDGASSSGRDSRSLMATVQRYVAGIKFCYDNALKKSPQLSGKITLQMDIAASGEVQGLETLDDSMGNAALERCVVSQAQSWRFAAIASGTVRFTLPLVFTPPQGVAP